MADKGLVVRDESQKPQVYRARHSEDRTQRYLLRDLLARAYDGSVRALMVHALGVTKPSTSDLEAIDELLKRFEEGKGR